MRMLTVPCAHTAQQRGCEWSSPSDSLAVFEDADAGLGKIDSVAAEVAAAAADVDALLRARQVLQPLLFKENDLVED
jgi:hypothetical protein